MRGFVASILLITAAICNAQTRHFEWSNRTWAVRDTSVGVAGPGPNLWSSDPSQVFVDDGGDLHLVTQPKNSSYAPPGSWACVEVFLEEPLGYGTYQFTVKGDVSDLDSNVVLGLFLYADDSHEIDIEFAKWGNDGATNADYVNQPNTGPDKALLWNQPALSQSSHMFEWFDASAIYWASAANESMNNPYQTFSTTASVPTADGMLLRINLWLFRGTTQMSEPLEVVISNFKFYPAPGTPTPPPAPSPAPPVPTPGPPAPTPAPGKCANAYRPCSPKHPCCGGCTCMGAQSSCHPDKPGAGSCGKPGPQPTPVAPTPAPPPPSTPTPPPTPQGACAKAWQPCAASSDCCATCKCDNGSCHPSKPGAGNC
jgi:hypothetical protein